MSPLRSRLVAALLALATASLPAVSAACDCAPLAPGPSLARADVVAFATFLRVGRRLPNGATEFVARVDRAWKGARAGETISVWSEGTSCDPLRGPWRGQRVFFLQRHEGRLRAHLCSLPDWGRRVELPEVARALDALTSDGRR